MKYKNYVKGLGETKIMGVCANNCSKMRSVPKLLSQAVMFLKKKETITKLSTTAL